MPLDDEPDEPTGFNQPLPPDDRLWRHPSELGPGAAANPMTYVAPRRRRGSTWLAAAASFAVGVAGTIGVLAAVGAFDETAPTTPVETVAIAVPKNPQASDLAVAEMVLPAVARIDGTSAAGDTSGTAVAYRTDGYLLTSADAVAGADRLTVTFADGSISDADLLGLDDENDLAVVRVDRQDLPTVTIGQPDGLELGEKTLVIAAVPDGSEPSIGVGLVSGLRQRLDPDGAAPMHGMIVANVRVHPGASGAPLVDTSGAVVGLVTRRGVAATATSPDTLAPRTVRDVEVRYATPIDWAKSLADDLADDGQITRVWLGVEGVDVGEDPAYPGGEPGPDEGGYGAKLTWVAEGSPAALAGLRPGDVLVALDDAPLLSMSDVVLGLRELQPGDIVKLNYRRGGEDGAALATLEGRQE